eukprot:GFYU01013266.1.p1 GENE.GFYU01013266.1~~GFYU01013266.1.p1  ORF type:complete len:275 (+),score=58.00 GFYU01013266.1:203-1027(+)
MDPYKSSVTRGRVPSMHLGEENRSIFKAMGGKAGDETPEFGDEAVYNALSAFVGNSVKRKQNKRDVWSVIAAQHRRVRKPTVQLWALSEAVMIGNAHEVRRAIAINKGMDVNLPLPDHPLGWSALHAAADRNYVPVIHILLSCGGTPTVYDLKNSTPLHRAAATGSVQAAQLFIKHKAAIDAQDDDGNTPLHLAAEMGYDEVLKLILDGGAGTGFVNKKGYTAEQTAERMFHKRSAELLRQGSKILAAPMRHFQTKRDTLSDKYLPPTCFFYDD